MRTLAPAFVAAAPSGTRNRTRLRRSPWDEAIVRMVGDHLGRLAGQDLAVRCRLGRAGGPDLRADRKRALTAESSSRWAGAITRTSNDQRERARKDLLDARAGLRRSARRVRSRLAVPVGKRQGKVRGYSSQEERSQKQGRLQHLQAELDQVEERLAERRVSVCRGGRSLAKLRHRLDRPAHDTGLPVTGAELRAREAQWRARRQAKRLFLTADGDASKVWGNQTIRVHPDQHCLDLRLPTPLAYLSNTLGKAPTFRLSCPVVFNHRRDERAARAASGAVRHDILFDPDKGGGMWMRAGRFSG